MKIVELVKLLKPYLGRIIFTIIGLIAATLFLSIGFWKTSIIFICCGIGYIIGLYKDKIIKIPEEFKFWQNRW